MNQTSYKIALLAYENCLSSTLFAFRDLIAFANEIVRATGKAGLTVDIVSAKGKGVTLAGGINVSTKSANRLKYHALVVPGFMFSDQNGLKQYLKRYVNEVRLLKSQHEKGTLIAGNCVGAFLLGEAGLLDNKHVTTSWLFEARLSRYYPHAQVNAKQIMIKDAGIITTGAFASMNDLAFDFITEHLGESVARKTQNLTLTPGVGKNQDKFVDSSFFTTTQSPFVSSVNAWLIKNLHQRYSLEALAAHMNMTPRTLMRRYKQQVHSTPLVYLQTQRMAQAKEWLLTSDKSIEQIAELVGYQDVNGFRKVFRREVGERPMDFRQSMGAMKPS